MSWLSATVQHINACFHLARLLINKMILKKPIIVTPTKFKSVVSIFCMAVALLLVFGTFFPWTLPVNLSAKLDPSWQIGLHVAFSEGLHFGQDLVFTYGPWGFLLSNKYHPQTYLYVLVFAFFLNLLLFWGLWLSSKHFILKPWTQLFWIAVIIFLPLPEGKYYVYYFLLFIIYFSDDDKFKTPILLTLVICVSLISLIKFTFAILSIFILFFITIDEIVRRHRLPLLIATYGFSFVVFWLLAGQPLGNLYPYFVNYLHTAIHYSEAMGRNVEASLLMGILWYISVAGLLVLVFALDAWRKRRFFSLLSVIALTGVLFLIFKLMIIRISEYRIILALQLLVTLTVMVIPRIWGMQKSRYLRACFLMTILLAIGAAWYGQLMYKGKHLIPDYLIDRCKYLIHNVTVAPSLLQGIEHSNSVYNKAKKRIRKEFPLPKLKGLVDCYPFAIGVIVAYDLPYSPRPVFQSHIAYTPALLMMNAEHLSGRRAPETVLFDIKPIDRRFPALDDSLSWPELWTRYNLRASTEELIVLERASRARSFELKSISKHKVKLGEQISLPSIERGPLWIQIDISTTWRYRLQGLLYVQPITFIEVQTRNGNLKSFRLIPSLARSGFVISPLITSRLDFAALYTRYWRKFLKDEEVSEIRILSTDMSTKRDYFGEVSVMLSRLDFENQDINKTDDPQHQDVLNRLQSRFLLSKVIALESKHRVIIKHPRKGRIRDHLFAMAPCRFALPVRPYGKRLKFSFGIYPGAWETAKPTDGVKFIVLAQYKDGTTSELWSRFLDPRNEPKHRFTQSAELELGNKQVKWLIFETLPGKLAFCDWSYWQDFVFEDFPLSTKHPYSP